MVASPSITMLGCQDSRMSLGHFSDRMRNPLSADLRLS